MSSNKVVNFQIAKDIVAAQMAQKEVSNFELKKVWCLLDKLQRQEKVLGVTDNTSLTSLPLRRCRTHSGAALYLEQVK